MNRRGFFGRLFGAAAAVATAPLTTKAVANVPAQPLVGFPSYVLMNSTTSQLFKPNATAGPYFTVASTGGSWWDREDDYDEDDD